MSVENVVERTPFREGAPVGAAAWVVGLVFWGIISGGRGGVTGVVFGYSLVHLWALFAGGGPSVLLFAVLPMGILAISGYVVADRSGVRGWIPIGGSVAVGYAAVVVPSHLLVGFRPVALAVALLFTAVLMPVVFAGLGGTFAGGTPEGDADADPDGDD